VLALIANISEASATFVSRTLRLISALTYNVRVADRSSKKKQKNDNRFGKEFNKKREKSTKRSLCKNVRIAFHGIKRSVKYTATHSGELAARTPQ
jgi:hypothetical protein